MISAMNKTKSNWIVTEMEGASVLDSMISESLTQEVTLEQRPE